MIISNVQRLYFDSVILTSILYPISTHWCWSKGWLAARGFIDFAGSGVVHVSGGIHALIGTYNALHNGIGDVK